MDYYLKPINDIISEFGSDLKNGLSKGLAEKKRLKYGPNELEKGEEISRLKIFLSQFKSPLVVILIIAVVFSMIIGEKKDAILILIIVIINAILGYFQEYKAEKAIEALERMASLKATVLRDGKEQKIDSKYLVPGDIIMIETGAKVPADARLVESYNLQTLESALTGESTPVEKKIDIIRKESGIGDRYNSIYSGTIVTRGRAKAIVVKTGMKTEIGKIATMIQEEKRPPTPLQLKLKKFSTRLGAIIGIITIIVFILRILKGTHMFESFRDSIALAVAAIPEGLPIVFTICLAIGVSKMVRRNALMRKLPSVETLGSVTVICSDKTGTLTHNKMTVKKIFVDDRIIDVSGKGYKGIGDFLSEGKKINPKNSKSLITLLQIGSLSNDSSIDKENVIGDPTEGALVVSAQKAGINQTSLKRSYPRIAEIPFSSERKMMSTVHKIGGRKVIYSKGAPDIILSKCTKILLNGKESELSSQMKKKVLTSNEGFADSALRVIGFAYKKLDHSINENGMVFVGLQAMIDPPRKEAIEAVGICKTAGIRTIMITGDHKNTAIAVARELGIEGKAIDGIELGKIKNLAKEVEKISIFARVNPEHKLRIVDALKKNGHVVAMTGDGVNDAPALKKADIGVAMGITGTDVSKEASDMILTDDNFSSIVGAVEEGRGIYSNIQKFIEYLLSSNLGEVLTILIAVLLGLPLPVLAFQLLWINLATDGFPALALGVEPKEKDIMKRKPRNPKEFLVTKYSIFRMIYISIIMMLGTLGLYYWALSKNGLGVGSAAGGIGYMYATTIAFTTLMMFQMFNVFNCRSENSSLFSIGVFTNRSLIKAVLLSVIFQLLVIYTPLSAAFETVRLSPFDWLLILGVSSSVLVVNEIDKLIRKYLVKSPV
ncbi:MAG: calcium-translocating P-type ATPase, SERCA-type [Candidatus Woesearchaeota archaeon]